jgi:thiamine-monophosphate kinase
LKRLKDLGEDEVIKLLTKLFLENLPIKTKLDPMDDVQAIDNDRIALKIDGFSESKSRYPWEEKWRWGWKAVTAVVSDLSAKGYITKGIAYSIGMPPNTHFTDLLEIAEGIKKALEEYDVLFLGGDTNESNMETWIDVAGIGFLSTTKPVPRKHITEKACRLRVFTTLKNGYGPPAISSYYYYRLGKTSVPKPVKDYLPKAVTEFTQIAKEATPLFSMDVSDGLAKTLWTIARLNKLVIRLIQLPPDTTLLSETQKIPLSPEETVLYGGEEFEIVFGILPENHEETLNACKKHGIECIQIGDAEATEKPMVEYKGKPVREKGWGWFRN